MKNAVFHHAYFLASQVLTEVKQVQNTVLQALAVNASHQLETKHAKNIPPLTQSLVNSTTPDTLQLEIIRFI